MRQHIYIRRSLAKLREEHGFTDSQLCAIAEYMNGMTRAELVRHRDYPTVTESMYRKLYQPDLK